MVRRRLAVLITVAGLPAGAANAQTSTLPGTPPAPPQPYTIPEPVRPNLPGSLPEELGTSGATTPTLVREGTFVSNAHGRMARGASGRLFFVFDVDSANRSLPPMVLLPNLSLAAAERISGHSGDNDRADSGGIRLLVTGQTTAYRGLNYLLLSAPPMLVRAEAPPPTPPTEPAAQPIPAAPDSPQDPASASNTPGTAEPSIDDIVRRLDRAASSVPATVPSRGAAVTGASATPTDETSEDPNGYARSPWETGTGVLASRRGRIVREPDGALAFVTDGGTEPGLGGGERFILLPSQTLAMIDVLFDRAGDAATYTVSGQVTVYKGRRYLLVRTYKVNRATEQVLPTQ